MFEVEVDCARNRLYVSLSGFALIASIEQFDADLRAALAALGRGREPHQLLYDVSAAKIQSQDVVSALRMLVRRSPRTSAFALVNASALAGRQLRRIFEGAGPVIFADRASAIEWLDRQSAIGTAS